MAKRRKPRAKTASKQKGTQLARYEGRIRGSSMPWVPATFREARELAERYGRHAETILIPTAEGLLEIRRLDGGDGT